MRDYLYAWNDHEAARFVASGIEFVDVAPLLRGRGGLILMRHEYLDCDRDDQWLLDHVPSSSIERILDDDLYKGGDFVWADYSPGGLAQLDERDFMRLLYFAHMRSPLNEVCLPTLGNRFLVAAHDDGFFLSIHYSDWSDVEPLVVNALEVVVGPDRVGKTAEQIRATPEATLCRGDRVQGVERTLDINSILNRHLY